MMDIGATIVEIQRSRGYTWGQMARELGVSESELSRYRRGVRVPSALVAQRIYKAALGPRPDWDVLEEAAPLLTAALRDTGTDRVKVRVRQPAPQRLPSGGRWIPGLIPLVEDDEEELR